MGISNDYGIAPAPLTEDPDPQDGNDGFLAYKEAGVDSFQFHIRGGSHEESALIPGMTVPVLGLATLRGSDLVAWYSTAWFDKHVKCAGGAACERDADQRLLTDRWRDDLRSGQVDANADPNVFSFYRRSRYDFVTADGERGRSATTCAPAAPRWRPDGLAPGYDFVADAYTPPAGGGGGGGGERAGRARCRCGAAPPTTRPGRSCPARRATRSAAAAATTACAASGGDDCLYGGPGRDRLRGDGGEGQALRRPRARRLRRRQGTDLLRAGPGNDVVRARDRRRDVVRCGAGAATSSRADRRDRLSGCETMRYAARP